jgi:3-methyl-2-oxobutanoate hydroxymethyltransferase
MSKIVLETGTSRATPSPVPGKRMTAPSIRARKVEGKTAEPIVMLTAYTMRMAQLLDPSCDMLLVGDSLGQVIYGLPSTIPVTLEMMCAHGAAVVRGSWHALVAVDMPFGSYEASPEQAFQSASRIMKETGCAAVKLEGGEAMAPTIEFLAHRGIPVIGHVGLTPQAVNVLGGYGARGKDEREADKIERDALAVDQAGAFCIVVEGVMEEIASGLVGQLGAPVIGIGASADCDGQVLVTEDKL